MKMKVREEGIKSSAQDRQVMQKAIAHHLLTNAQPSKQ